MLIILQEQRKLNYPSSIYLKFWYLYDYQLSYSSVKHGTDGTELKKLHDTYLFLNIDLA